MEIQVLLITLLSASTGAMHDGTTNSGISNSTITNGPRNNGPINNDVFGPHCSELERTLRPSELRNVSIFGKPRVVVLQWGARAPGRAAAALLAAALRHRLGFRNVQLEPGPRRLCDLAAQVPDLRYDDEEFNKLVIHVGAEWQGRDEDCAELQKHCTDPHDICGAAGSRLYGQNEEIRSRMLSLVGQMIGAPPAPMTLHLQARLSTPAWNNPACTNARLAFRSNLTVLTQCGFHYDVAGELEIADLEIPTTKKCNSPSSCIPILVQPDWTHPNASYETASVLARVIQEEDLPFRLVPLVDDSGLRTLLPELNSSVFFLDYNLWSHEIENRILLLQPKGSLLNPVNALLVGDTKLLRQYTPDIHDVVSHFKLESKEFLSVLQREANGLTIEEAACAHALSNLTNFKSWSIATKQYHWICVLFCDDMSPTDYEPIYQVIGRYLEDTFKGHIEIGFRSKDINCRAANNLTRTIMDIEKQPNFMQMIGMTAAGEDTAAAADHAKLAETQFVIYDLPPDAAKLSHSGRSVTGRVRQLAYATKHFLLSNGWRRIAVISERTRLSNDFTRHLADSNELILGERLLESVDPDVVKNTLQQFVDDNGRVFFVNSGPATAGVVLCIAFEMGLILDAGYAWVVREWRGSGISCNSTGNSIEHFSVSFWWRGGDDSTLPTDSQRSKELRRKMDLLWPGRAWPPLAASFADAMLLLAHITAYGISDNPSRRFDLHGDGAARVFSESFSKHTMTPVAGVVQDLRLSESSLAEPLVFVHAWPDNGSMPETLAVWRVNGTSIYSVEEIKKTYPELTSPHDGTARCLTHSTGPAFRPRCHDAAWLCALVAVALTPLALWAARRARLAQLKARDRALYVRLLARCERTASALAEHLVQRSALTLHEELGTGHFGRVRLGMLRLPHRPTVPVAVKALREDAMAAEEAEFLREACTLAGLSHEHVVRLAGVCAVDGPPLLLMDHAFFGDLLKYLRERRHLAEFQEDDKKEDSEAEAVHVSPRELTRLAREAASALAYLARMRVVHRDVRAANCLIDQARSLKLADFGMARKIGCEAPEPKPPTPGEDPYTYVCRRRGVFPVPWMAPESLARGVWTPASDVWALGVVILELVSLGARPYGALRPRRVLGYVRGGGAPPLPRDASTHTREVLEMCWRLAPDARLSAAAVQHYLEQRPAALCPALRPAWPEHAPQGPEEGDSGFGERDERLESDPHVSTL